MRSLAVALGAAILVGGCPSRPLPQGPGDDRCPTADRIGPGPRAARWQVEIGAHGWLVCRDGHIRYRAARGVVPPARLASGARGELVAFLEHQGGGCRLVVLEEGADPHRPLRFPMPGCRPSWRPQFTDDVTINVGPSPLDPKVRVRLERE